MKQLFTACALLLFVFAGITFSGNAQTLQSGNYNLINNLPARTPVVFGGGGLHKTTGCPADTINYPWNKTTQLSTVSLNNVNSGNAFAQWYPCPQAITVSGFEFYGWQTGMNGIIVPLTCRIYNAGIDSLPVGTPLASVTVNVDTTFGGGLLSVLRKKAVFSAPVTVSSPNGYVLTVETTSNTNVAIVSNSWTATPSNGRGEWLSSVRIFNNPSFLRSYNINIGGNTFNADFLIQPFVSYNLTANFTPSISCMSVGTPIIFTNNSSPVLFNKFYSTRAFFNIPQFSCLWDYGDSMGSYWALNGVRTYNFNATYRVTLQDTLYGWTTGCGDKVSKDINQSPDPTIANNNGPICAGGTLKLFADSVPGVTGYAWTGPNGFTSTQRNPVLPSAGIAASGQYSVVTTIGQCSSAVASTYATIISSYAAGSNSPLCAGQGLSLNATQINGATYAWTGPNGFSSSLQSPTRPNMTKSDSGVYSVTITLAGCGVIGPLNALVVVNDVPSAPVAGSNGPVCVGQNLSLTAGGPAGGVYNWTGPNNFSSTQQNPVRPSATASFAGTYNVVVTMNGCTSIPASTNVTVNNNPTAPTAGNNGPVCTSQVLSLTASLIPGATYSWSGPDNFSSSLQNPTRDSLTLLRAGTYSVIATVNGCASPVANTNVVITTTTPAPVAGSNGPLCPGQNLQLTASAISGATYNWTGPKGFTSNAQNPLIPNINDSNAGLYSVTATTTTCGTSPAGTVNLVVNTLPPAPNLGNNGPLCEGQNLNLTAGSITGANYFWSGPSGFSSSAQNPLVTGITKAKAGVYSAYVSVPGCGTSSTSSTTVVVHSVPNTPSALSNSPVCSGDSLRLFAAVNNVGPNAIFNWTGPNNYMGSGRNNTLGNVLSSDAGIYQVSVSDSGCNSNNGSVNVVVRNLPAAPLAGSNGPVCTGATLSLTASTIASASYSWSGPQGFASNAQNPSITNATSKNSGEYSVRSFALGCYSVPATVNAIVKDLPEAPVASNTGPGCVGDNITLQASTIPGATYNWSGPGYTSNQQNPVLSNLTKGNAGTYSVSVIVSSCTSPEAKTDVVVNSIPEAPLLSSLPNVSACTGDSLRFYANYVADGIYDWNGPLGFTSSKQNPVMYVNNTAQGGTYNATVTRYGCVSPKASLVIQVHGSPNTSGINGISSVSSGEVVSYNVTGSSGSSFDWVLAGGTLQTGAGTSVVTVLWGPKGTGNIQVTETNSAGCKGITQSKKIDIGPAAGLESIQSLPLQCRVYPNPTTGQFVIEPLWNENLQVQVMLLDLSGRLVKDFGKHQAQAGQHISLDADQLSNGIYLLQINAGNHSMTEKLVVAD